MKSVRLQAKHNVQVVWDIVRRDIAKDVVTQPVARYNSLRAHVSVWRGMISKAINHLNDSLYKTVRPFGH